MKERKIGRYLFMGILLVNVISHYAVGSVMLTNTQYALESGFGITYTSDLAILGLVIGLALIFVGSIALIGVVLTRKRKMSGVITGSAVGTYMLLFGILNFMMFGTTDGLIIDSSRGFLTLVFAYMAYKELKSVHK